MSAAIGVLSYETGIDASGVRRDPEARGPIRRAVVLAVAGSAAMGEDADQLIVVLRSVDIPVNAWDIGYIRAVLPPSSSSSCRMDNALIAEVRRGVGFD
jgi:hypothetical protein